MWKPETHINTLKIKMSHSRRLASWKACWACLGLRDMIHLHKSNLMQSLSGAVDSDLCLLTALSLSSLYRITLLKSNGTCSCLWVSGEDHVHGWDIEASQPTVPCPNRQPHLSLGRGDWGEGSSAMPRSPTTKKGRAQDETILSQRAP